MLKLLNSFSANMLPPEGGLVCFDPLTLPEAAAMWAQAEDKTSAVGHADTAALFATLLGNPVVVNRVSVTLADRGYALLGQYRGPRLAEGVTELPLGATVAWYRVRFTV